MTGAPPAVTTSLDDGVLTIRLARPRRRNVLDLESAPALLAALRGTDNAGAVALLADGDHFCVGGDVGSFTASDDPAAHVRSLADAFHEVVRAVRGGPPVVVGVRGWAAGAGMSLVLACDVTVFGETASLRPAYPGIGLTPDGGMTWTLPRQVGERTARSILLRNAVVDAPTGHRLGLADEVVPDSALDARVLDIARELARGPREAHCSIKRLLDDSAGAPLDMQLEAEAHSIARHSAGADGQEGIRAFLERRAPRFGERTTDDS